MTTDDLKAIIAAILLVALGSVIMWANVWLTGIYAVAWLVPWLTLLGIYWLLYEVEMPKREVS